MKKGLFGNLLGTVAKSPLGRLAGPVGSAYALFAPDSAGGQNGESFEDRQKREYLDARLAESEQKRAAREAQARNAALAGGGGPGGGYGGYGGGGAGGYNPNVDPAQIAAAKNEAFATWNELNNLYSHMSNQVDVFGADRRSQIDTSYGEQFQAADKDYSNAVAATNGAYTARNTYDSSWRGGDLQRNQDAYTNQVKSLERSRDDNYAQLGQTLASYKQQFANRPQWLGDGGDVNTYRSARDNYRGAKGELQGKQYNIFTQGQLQNELNKIAPAKNSLAATVKGRLDQLIASSAAPEAKWGIAKNTIDSIKDPKEKEQLLSYWNSLNAPKQAS